MSVKTLVVTLALLLIALPVAAGIGVGIYPGRIILDEPMRPWQTASRTLGVVNMGDSSGVFYMSTMCFGDQVELCPDAAWIEFVPQSFELAPRQTQLVTVRLTIAPKAKPGSYHCLLAAGTGNGIGVAVATRLYFEVKRKRL